MASRRADSEQSSTRRPRRRETNIDVIDLEETSVNQEPVRATRTRRVRVEVEREEQEEGEIDMEVCLNPPPNLQELYANNSSRDPWDNDYLRSFHALNERQTQRDAPPPQEVIEISEGSETSVNQGLGRGRLTHRMRTKPPRRNL